MTHPIVGFALDARSEVGVHGRGWRGNSFSRPAESAEARQHRPAVPG
jgi:hypothetical protein